MCPSEVSEFMSEKAKDTSDGQSELLSKNKQPDSSQSKNVRNDKLTCEEPSDPSEDAEDIVDAVLRSFQGKATAVNPDDKIPSQFVSVLATWPSIWHMGAWILASTTSELWPRQHAYAVSRSRPASILPVVFPVCPRGVDAGSARPGALWAWLQWL